MQETIPIILKKGKGILTMKSLCDCETFGYEQLAEDADSTVFNS